MNATSPTAAVEKISVPLLDLQAQYRTIESEIMETIQRVCTSQRFILGPAVDELERAIATYSQAKFGIGVSSGTDALLLALMALEVGPGDEVITTPYTFFATGGAIARLGARPLYCDIDPVSYNLSPQKVADFLTDVAEVRDDRVINRRTGGTIRAIIPVHLYGQCADMDPLLEIARRYKLRVIEDAAQAIGSESPGQRRAGSMGDIGCFSFFPSKNLGAFGDGGMCTANDPALAERMKILRAHGSKPKYYHSFIGGNFRLDELQAAILLVKLKYLDSWSAKRKDNAAFYDAAFARAGLGRQVVTPTALPGYRHIYNQYVLRVERRDALKEFLGAAGIGTEVYYPVPLHAQPCFAYLGGKPEDCPESMRAAADTVAIPIYPELSDVQKQYVVDTVARFYNNQPR